MVDFIESNNEVQKLIGERLCGYTNHQKHNSIDLVLEL